jgi:ABC-type bacteriocin/lantibiotic exporter with double-glycine peptidase domain
VALSGGQRQRLALARLVLRPAQLILLDDPLSAVDADTEATVIRNLKECWSTITVVLTSNKTSTLDCCHRRAIISSDGLIFQGHHFENNRIYEGLAHG